MQKAMRHTFLVLSLITTSILLSGCQSSWFPGVYKIDVQQGNIIDQEMIDQLKPGMSKRQVRYIMGNPIIQDTFQPDRWDYYYQLNKGKGGTEKERVSIFFDGDNLSHFSGDYVPTSAKPATEAE